jgi:signal transduction histidine kinase
MVVQAEAGIVRAAGETRTTRTFETIAGTGREALTQLDRALGVLRGDGPHRQPEPGLGELPQLVERARLAGLDAELTESGAPRPVPTDLAAAVYRLVQEAVTNAVKHAAASRIRIEVSDRDGRVHVAVRDDGVGFDQSAPAGGFGVIGMRERVALAGGTLEIESEPGAGTTVTAELPARRDESVARVA